eukprot:NODE_523_length_6504_cov_0.524434.p1 type:complete len:139 gc:universal NODE_523_length_6504_cov_0.524434:4354-3938(-)
MSLICSPVCAVILYLWMISFGGKSFMNLNFLKKLRQVSHYLFTIMPICFHVNSSVLQLTMVIFCSFESVMRGGQNPLDKCILPSNCVYFNERSTPYGCFIFYNKTRYSKCDMNVSGSICNMLLELISIRYFKLGTVIL